MKRNKPSSSSESSDDCPSTSFFPGKIYKDKIKTKTEKEQKKPAEVFRKDLISAMKIPDTHHINPDSYYLFTDTWKEEWEKGVQVPANLDTLPQPSIRILPEKVNSVPFVRPRKYIRCSSSDPEDPDSVNIMELSAATCRYDLDDMDIIWLQELNHDLSEMGQESVNETLMEKIIEALERICHERMSHAIKTVEGLGIEYDEDVICDVCRSPDSEEGNDMVFCDKCNICVHQACYGILKIPPGNWLCRTCVLGISPKCILCPKKGGALKSTRTGSKWAHVSCALWIPEVSIACPERMEPIIKISHIPPSRWALVCTLCKLKTGACIQCSVRSCTTAFHVTCAFEHNLEMKTVLDDGDEVKFKSFCLKHSQNRQSLGEVEPHSHRAAEPSQTKSEKNNVRAQKLRELEEEFYSFVKAEDVATELELPVETVDFIYNYWKLKRKSNFNKPLFPPKLEEENVLVQPKEENIHTRMRMFMHLRQDLERVRNLCYMISRREKLKLSQNKLQEQIFNLQAQIMHEDNDTGSPLTTALENALFSSPSNVALKLGARPIPEDCRNGTVEIDHRPCSPVSGLLALSERSLQLSDEPLDLQVKSRSKPPLENNNCLLESHNYSRNKANNSSSPTQKPPSSEFSRGPSVEVEKSLVSEAVLCGNSQPSSESSKSNGIEDNLSVNVTQEASASEISSNQEPMVGSHLASPSSFRKSTMEKFRSFKETTKKWGRSSEGPQCYVKPMKNINPKEQIRGRQLLKRSSERAACPETDGYCPDLELSDSESETDGNNEKAIVKNDSSDKEIPPQDSEQDCHSESEVDPLPHGSKQR
ncbi:protein Jade-3 [Perognathus longimembris pacificus]|uniref:protein Jade-3 n=1 Tax=Perognathus longimembris pacificus TaxID=214514 RepID=UPI0020199E8D|nr:protein Jade-3 [Perognathus longimembris pacificus]